MGGIRVMNLQNIFLFWGIQKLKKKNSGINYVFNIWYCQSLANKYGYIKKELIVVFRINF